MRSPAPPGKDSEAGDVKALACCAVEGWVVRESISTCERGIDVRVDRKSYLNRDLYEQRSGGAGWQSAT